MKPTKLSDRMTDRQLEIAVKILKWVFVIPSLLFGLFVLLSIDFFFMLIAAIFSIFGLPIVGLLIFVFVLSSSGTEVLLIQTLVYIYKEF